MAGMPPSGLLSRPAIASSVFAQRVHGQSNSGEIVQEGENPAPQASTTSWVRLSVHPRSKDGEATARGGPTNHLSNMASGVPVVVARGSSLEKIRSCIAEQLGKCHGVALL
eukprot:SAG31_NODE_4425_length_3246_cov_1.445186_1_plen_111_part_00